MAYGEAKVYYDGSHYIAIPHTERPPKPRVVKQEKEIFVNDKNEVMAEYDEVKSTLTLPSGKVLEEVEFVGNELKPVIKKIKREGKKTTKKKIFEEAYAETVGMNKAARRKILVDRLKGCFRTIEETKMYVDSNLERKNRNLLCRRIRLNRKANLQEFNYFCTFTYDNKKHDEESFRKKLRTCLKNYAVRYGWKYIGVWERSPEQKRLHFHGIFYIPNGTMPGELEKHRDYNLNTKRMQETMQNTFFNKKFGRSDFEAIDSKDRIGEALNYLLKYIEKTGEKIVYSRGLPQFFISDIMDEDIACFMGEEEYKVVLFDDFQCIDEGTLMGTVSKEVIQTMRKAN